MRWREEGGCVSGALRIGAVAFGCALLANCASSDSLTSRVDPKYGVAASPRVIEPGQPVPKGGGAYRVGKPYLVAGRMYVPEENRNYRGEGLASWYGADFHGRLTANGEIYDMESISAAHPTLPMPSYVRVTNLANRRSLIVRVNDRGPYHANREIDVSVRAAQLLDFHRKGVVRVRVEFVAPAPLEGSDDRKLTATLREGQPAPAPSAVMVASARPFLPRLGDTPVPPERPFDLGHSGADGRVAAAPAQGRQVTAAPLPGVAYAEARTVLRATPPQGPVLTRTPAGSGYSFGYAPTANMGTNSLATGRGLY